MQDGESKEHTLCVFHFSKNQSRVLLGQKSLNRRLNQIWVKQTTTKDNTTLQSYDGAMGKNRCPKLPKTVTIDR